MRIAGLKTVKVFSRWLQARVLGGAMILGYHRIANASNDEYGVCITEKHFAEQMEILSKFTRPISLSKLVQYLNTGSVPLKSVAVTFDDGYVDNLYKAKPILEEHEIPATVFVCTGYSGKEFWWDELERLVMSSQADLNVLCLKSRGGPFRWEQANGDGEAECSYVRSRFRHALYHFLLPLDIEERNEAMDKIRVWSGSSATNSSIPRGMSHQELLQLTKGGLVEVGAHTRHHPMLPSLPLERQQDEIISSKRDLEGMLGKEVRGFAYPNGQATTDAKRILQEGGFTFACTSLHDVVRPGKDLYELTRFWQKDVDGDHFMKGIRLWMNLY